MAKLEMTYSRVKTFLECPMKEYFSYRVNGVGITIREPYVPFIAGEMLHYALSKFHDPNCQMMLKENMIKRVNKIIDSFGPMDSDLLDKLQTDMYGMIGACLGYKERYATDKTKYETLFVEKEFTFELHGFTWRGKLDWVVRNMDKKLMFVEEKSTSESSDSLANKYSVLPLDLQGLIYTKGVEAVTGEMPELMCWDFILKTKLRRKGDIEKGNLETLPDFAERVKMQYLEEPEKKFFRTPPLLVQKQMVENVNKQLGFVANRIACEVPHMSFDCLGMYGTPCKFAPACTAKLKNHKDGWDAGECLGIYKVKEAQHEELDAKPKDEEVTETVTETKEVKNAKKAKKQ